MKNYKILFLMVWFLVGASCQKKGTNSSVDGNTFTIKGKLQNTAAGPIYLSELGEQQFVTRDTATVAADGTFTFTGKRKELNIYRISLTPQNGLLLVIDTPSIEVTADAKNLQQTYNVIGSPESSLIKSLIKKLENNQIQKSGLEQRFARAQQAGRNDSLLVYQQQYLALDQNFPLEIRKFIRANPTSFVSAYAAFALLKPEADFEFLDSTAVVFNKNIPDVLFVKMLTERLNAVRNVTIGKLAPEISLPNPEGTVVNLSSLKGKYVLIDFWASWCGPCRQENPNVVRLYNKYKDKGFEIYGVSLDDSKEKWMAAIAKDKLTWPHVSDLKGYNSSAANLYNVQAIPQTILLDKEGKIIARNLRGPSLEQKLESLFN